MVGKGVKALIATIVVVVVLLDLGCRECTAQW
jgi:hypothetical protein